MEATSDGNGGRTRAYQALHESEELHRATLSSISDAVFMTDDAGAFTYVCPNVDVIFGYVPDEVQAMATIGALLGDRLFDRAELSARGEIPNLERDVTSKSGARRTVLIQVKQVTIRGGTVLYTCRDITERKQAEEELRTARADLAHAARLALVGQLMTSIVHEISQPLTAIASNAAAGLRSVGRETTDGAMVHEIFVDMSAQASTVIDIIERLRSLARKRPLEFQALDVNATARDVLRLIESDAQRRGVTLQAVFEPGLPAINGDRVSLQQVLLNLLVNAMDALDGVETERRMVSVTSRTVRGVVEIAVSDTGPGIPAESLGRLFDAFYTTRNDGIGIGLKIAKSIADAHGGHISVESLDGHGATFRLALPVA